jgi:hypothetical protein
MTKKSSDPTKDPEFQKVVQGFLRTKPKPHKTKSNKRKRQIKTKEANR